MFYGGSTSAASIVEFRDGAFQPILSPGDQPLGATFAGINIYGQAQRTPNGDLYAQLANGIGRYIDGKWDLAIPIPTKIDDVTATNIARIAVNANGAIAWACNTDKGDIRIYLSQDGRHQLIATNGLYTQAGAVIDGQAVASFDDFFVDDLNRIFIRLRFRGATSPVLYVWSQGTWKLALKLFETPIAGRPVTGWTLRAIGSRFFAILQNSAGAYVTEWTSGGWQILLTPTDVMPTGIPLGAIYNHFEPDAAGGMAFLGSAFPSNMLYVRKNNQTSTVLSTARRTADGDLLVNILSIDFRDDGGVWVLALNERSELVLYQAQLK